MGSVRARSRFSTALHEVEILEERDAHSNGLLCRKDSQPCQQCRDRAMSNEDKCLRLLKESNKPYNVQASALQPALAQGRSAPSPAGSSPCRGCRTCSRRKA